MNLKKALCQVPVPHLFYVKTSFKYQIRKRNKQEKNILTKPTVSLAGNENNSGNVHGHTWLGDKAQYTGYQHFPEASALV